MKSSIALCTYNGERFIAEQLKSILSQTRLPDEIIVRDDCSTDNTVKIANSLLENSGIDYRIEVNKTNLGCGQNFLKCYDSCKGEVIFSCDQDDIWENTKVETIMDLFENNSNVTLVFSNAELIDSNGESLGITLLETIGVPKDFYIDREFYKNRLYGDTFGNFLVYGCCNAFRKEFYKMLLPFPEGWYFDSYIAICAPIYGEIVYINESLIKYRQHEGNHSGSLVNRKESVSTNNKSFDERFKNPYIYFEFYKSFFDRNKELLSTEDKKRVKRSIDFYSSLNYCKSAGKIKAMITLTVQYLKGNYKLLRGGFKVLVCDTLYIVKR